MHPRTRHDTATTRQVDPDLWSNFHTRHAAGLRAAQTVLIMAAAVVVGLALGAVLARAGGIHADSVLNGADRAIAHGWH